MKTKFQLTFSRDDMRALSQALGEAAAAKEIQGQQLYKSKKLSRKFYREFGRLIRLMQTIDWELEQ